MNSMVAVTVLLVIFAIGDFVAKKTKAIFSMVLFVALALLSGFWLGLPKTIIADAKVPQMGMIAAGLLITSMGTLIDFAELKKQWKTVVIGVSAVLGIGILMIFVGGPILGRELSIVAAPILAGGSAATIIMTSTLDAKGMGELSVFCILVLVSQKFVGIPVASIALKKEAKRIVGLYRKNEYTKSDGTIINQGAYVAEKAGKSADSEDRSRPRRKIIPPMPSKYQTPFILMAKLALVATISIQLAALTNGAVNKFVVFLLMGIIASELGFLEKDILKKANANGFILFLATAIIFASLSKATPQMVTSYIGPLLIALGLGIIAVIIAGFIGSKILKLSPPMAIAIGISCMFGFPTTYFIPHEVADAVAETEEEKELILSEILPKMLVAGFVTVTIASALFAGFLVELL